MEEIKAIFFDIDGTLVDLTSRKVPESTLDSLNKLREKGVKLFVCSGRHPSFRETLIKEVGFEFDSYIFCNGQYITDKEGNPLYKLPFDKESKEKLYHFLKKNKWLNYTVMEEEEIYITKPRKRAYPNQPQVLSIDRMLEHDVYQVCPYGPKIVDYFILKKNSGAKSARWHPAFADIIPASGGKDKGIDKILEMYQIDIKNTMSFGDAANDIPMLKECHIGVAMGNGTKEAKAVADYITTPTYEDGIYNALKHFEVL